jgi:hypothetical protein
MDSVEPAGSLLLGQGQGEEEGEGEVVTNPGGDGGDGGEAGADAGADAAAESAAEGAAKKSDNILNQLGELPDASPDLIKQLKNLKESTRHIDYVEAFKRIIQLSDSGDDEVNIYLLKKMGSESEATKIDGNNPYHCIDIVGLLQRLSINKLLDLIDKKKIPNDVEIGNIGIFSLLLRFIDTGKVKEVIGNDKYNFSEAGNFKKELMKPEGSDRFGHYFGGVKRKKSSKKSSLKTHSINNLRWLVHIGLRSLQQINSGKKPSKKPAATKTRVAKKPAVATKDDLLKVAKKLKLSGLSNKTKKDIAAAIRKVDVKKLNESQKKTLEKFKNMKM